MSGRRRAGSTLSSTLLMDRQLSQGFLFSATSTSFLKYRLNQCLNLSLVSEIDKEIGLDYLRTMHLYDSKTDCNSKKDYHQNIGLYVLPTITDWNSNLFVPRRGHLEIAAFQHILQDPRSRNIPPILLTPGLKQPKEVCGKEIVALQTLSSISLVIKSEDLQSLVHEIKSVVEEAKIEHRREETHGEWATSKKWQNPPRPCRMSPNLRGGAVIVVEETPPSRRPSSIYIKRNREGDGGVSRKKMWVWWW